jgi:hypothetical protein
MKCILDVPLGFLVAFSIDRAVRLVSASSVVPWAQKRGEDVNRVEAMKLGTELGCLLLILFILLNKRHSA